MSDHIFLSDNIISSYMNIQKLKNSKYINGVFISFIMNLLGMILTKLYYMSGINSIFIELISIFLGGQFLFVLGIVIAKYAMFNKIKEKVKLRNINYFIILIVSIIVNKIISLIDKKLIINIIKA